VQVNPYGLAAHGAVAERGVGVAEPVRAPPCTSAASLRVVAWRVRPVSRRRWPSRRLLEVERELFATFLQAAQPVRQIEQLGTARL
jgi:hypothetical protein